MIISILGLLICIYWLSSPHCHAYCSLQRCIADSVHATPHERRVAAHVVCRWAGSIFQKKRTPIFLELGLLNCMHRPSIPHYSARYNLYRSVAGSVHATPHVRGGAACVVYGWEGSLSRTVESQSFQSWACSSAHTGLASCTAMHTTIYIAVWLAEHTLHYESAEWQIVWCADWQDPF